MTFGRPRNDVSAVVLTIGEPTTQLAIDSLHRQVVRVRDIIIVRDVVPFHKALNAGAAQVKTPFFVQVDADMILDPHCIAALRSGMRRGVGIVVGHLRDELAEQVVGIKMFRTECFETAVFRDSISPDTDFVDEIAQAGWKTVYVGKITRLGPERWATFGEHRPTYTPSYTYRKFMMEGGRYRYRRDIGGFRWRLARLGTSRHALALVAQIGLVRGIFLEANRDLLGLLATDESFSRFETLLCNPSGAWSGTLVLPSPETPSDERFRLCYRLGTTLFHASDLRSVERHMDMLNGAGPAAPDWIARVGLCRGLLAQDSSDEAIDADYQALQRLIETCEPPPASWTGTVDRDGQSVASLSASGSEDELAEMNPTLGPIAAYAEKAGLDRFVMDGPSAAEYRIDRSGLRVVCLNTGRPVTVATDADGRPRIKAPFRLLGHLACTDPERITGIFWCFDLLRAGYLFAHLPTPLGPRKVSVISQLLKNLLGRVAWQRESVTSPGQIKSGIRAAFGNMARHRCLSYRPEPDRVLMVSHDFIRGGSERQMVAAASGLVQRGYDVRMLGLGRLEPGVPSFEEEISRLGISPVHRSDFVVPQAFGFRQLSDVSLGADLSRLPDWLADRIGPVSMAIRRYRPAVVHGWLDIPGVVAALAACAFGVPRVVIQQGSMAPTRHRIEIFDLLREAYRTLARNPNVVIVNNSAAGAADYERWLGVPAGTIRVHYNGFMPESVRRPEPHEILELRRSLRLPGDARVVGTVIRFVEDKDPDLWLDTAAEIANARPDVWYLLAGYGPLRDAIMHRIRSLGLGDRVILPGPVTDIGLVLAVLDVVLLTSIVEGVPNVLIEAQAAGRPVVTTDVGGTCEAILEGRTGRIVPQRSAKLLAEAVTGILDDPAWPARARTEGPAFVAGRFGLDRLVRETLDIYDLQRQAPFGASRPEQAGVGIM